MVTGASLRPSAISGKSPALMISATEGSLITCRLGAGPGTVAWKGSKPGVSAVAPPIPDAEAMAPVAGCWPSSGTSPLQPARCAASKTAVRERRPGTRASSSALLHGRERLLEFLDRRCPRHFLTVDKEGWRRANAEAICGSRSDFDDVIHKLLICQTFVEAFLGEAGLFGELEKLRHRIAAHKRPLVLLGKERRNQGKGLVPAGAARQHRSGHSEFVEGELAHDKAHLAGVDEPFFDRRKNLVVEIGAVTTG